MKYLALLQQRIHDPQAEPVAPALLEDLIEAAKDYILTLRYPFGDYPVNDQGEVKFPSRYDRLVVDMAVEMVNKMGAEGELAHVEPGVDRRYAAAYISPELRARVIPKVKVL